MNESASRPRLTRGAHNPKAGAYSIAGLFTQLLPLLAYIGRVLNDTMCDHGAQAGRQMVHGAIENAPICDRCQRKLFTLGTVISGTATYVADWGAKLRAQLDARLAIAAARRLVDTVELGETGAWAMAGGAVVTTARHAINAALSLMNTPDLGRVNEANAAARSCQEMDLSTCRVARKHGLVQESYVIGFVLKAASKAAEAAVAAWETTHAMPGEERERKLAQMTEDAAGAAIGAALDGAALLERTGRAESMMVVATGVCAEYDRIVRPADADPQTYGKSTSQKVTPGASPEDNYLPAELWAAAADADRVDAGFAYIVDAPISLGGPALVTFPEPAALPAWLETPTEEHDVLNEFDEVALADVADEAIGDAAALASDLERAETVLNAIAEEHRAVEQCVRTTREDGSNAGLVTEYYQECCVVCRDAKGRPVLAPCRTMLIVQSFGEPF